MKKKKERDEYFERSIRGLNYERIQKLREGITEYAGKFNEKQLKEKTFSDLTNFLSETIKDIVIPSDLSLVFYYEINKEKDIENASMIKDHPAFFMDMRITRENESLERITKLLGKSIDELNEEDAMTMFKMDNDTYKALTKGKGIEVDKEYHFDFTTDSTILPGLLQAKGLKFGRPEIRKTLMEIDDFGLGYFNTMFKGKFAYDTRDDSMWNEGIHGLNNAFHNRYSEYKKDLEQHLKTDKALTEKHKISQPQLLPDKTLELNIVPYAIDFASDERLVVLGGNTDLDNKDYDTRMILQVYDKEGMLQMTANADLHSRFDGAAGMCFNFQGSLTVGSDDIIYVNGDSRRFSMVLEELRENESKFEDAKVQIKDVISSDHEIFQVVENDGIFYFALQPRWSPKCYNNVIVASDGEKIIGVPLGYSPSGGSSSGMEDDTPRIQVHGNELYFKISKQIFTADLSLTKEAWENAFPMIRGKEGIGSPIPSNHCITKNGIVYAVTKFKEEAAQSIHGYIKGKEEGEFVTHVYPEDFPGGGASFRSMAISPDGILAYTSQEKNKIHFYKLAGEKINIE